MASNGVEDGGKLGSIITALKNPRLANGILLGAALATQTAPQILARLRGQTPPTVANVAALAWTQPVTIAPGQAVTVHVFGRKLPDGTVGPTFTIPVANLPTMKAAQ